MKFQLLIKTKVLKSEDLSSLKLSDVVFIMLINVKMTTFFLTFMSMINMMLSLLEHEKNITSGPGVRSAMRVLATWRVATVFDEANTHVMMTQFLNTNIE